MGLCLEKQKTEQNQNYQNSQKQNNYPNLEKFYQNQPNQEGKSKKIENDHEYFEKLDKNQSIQEEVKQLFETFNNLSIQPFKTQRFVQQHIEFYFEYNDPSFVDRYSLSDEAKKVFLFYYDHNQLVENVCCFIDSKLAKLLLNRDILSFTIYVGYLSELVMSHKSFTQLINIIQSWQNLSSLNLNLTKFIVEDFGFISLASTLSKCLNIQNLTLNLNSKFRTEGSKNFAKAILNCQKLANLTIDNQLTYHLIEEALQNNQIKNCQNYKKISLDLGSLDEKETMYSMISVEENTYYPVLFSSFLHNTGQIIKFLLESKNKGSHLE
ncbi:hypothetical protein ABPG74_018646 [Tetrahymena malaccensis]